MVVAIANTEVENFCVYKFKLFRLEKIFIPAMHQPEADAHLKSHVLIQYVCVCPPPGY